MAWETPKTNWQSQDGVRNTDLNRIEGNILELYNSAGASSAIQLYVTASGNDTTGTGTSAAPFRTINKALSMVPKNLSGRSATINVGAGTYSESVLVSGFSSPIMFMASSGAVANVNGFRVDGCTCIITNLQINSTDTITVTNGGKLISEAHMSVDGPSTGVIVTRNSTLVCNATLTVYDCASRAIDINRSSAFYAYTLSGSGNTLGIVASKGSFAMYTIQNMSTTGAMLSTTDGSRIYTGAQSGLL